MNNCPNCGQEVNCKFVESVIDEIVADVREENIDLTTEILQVKSFKEGHQFGGDEERERISDLLIQSMPDDAENLSTLTGWQARHTIENFLKHLGED